MACKGSYPNIVNENGWEDVCPSRRSRNGCQNQSMLPWRGYAFPTIEPIILV